MSENVWAGAATVGPRRVTSRGQLELLMMVRAESLLTIVTWS